ncbi:CBS domain-containing protein [Salinispirillum sp. LH 10-3-1]|uniref:CBS domain-containing protein n=1 Tax=Salinispirillum sp. LH 10-3-1 TaxID=2952525 RepID=A0AB38YJR9_9GAMM
MTVEAKTVAQYMITTHKTVRENSTVSEAVHQLLKAGLPGCVVVDALHHPVGFLSEQDCLRQMLEGRYHQSDSALVRDVMSQTIISVAPDMSIVELAQMMIQPKPKIYPVIDNGKLVGEIRRSDVLRALSESR